MIMDLNWILFVFLSLSMAELAIQIVTSELSSWIMGQLRLTIPYNRKLDVLGKVKFWRSLLKYGWFFAIPIIFLIKIHEFFAHMLSCPFCTSFHLAWISYVFILNIPILYALLFAPITLVFVALLDRIHTH